MTQRVISPPLTEHPQLRQKLTAGEKRVFDLFNEHLPNGWEIYIQPHLNGLRPDFVLLNPNGGIAVFEVKDWNLSAMRYFNRDGQLWAEKDGQKFRIENPVAKVSLYKKEIFDLYCPRLERGNGWAAITAGVIFPFARAAEVKDLLRTRDQPDGDKYARYQPISGAAEVSAGNLGAIFPESIRSNSMVMSESLAKDLRGWLVEPDFSSTQRTPLVLDHNQRRLADSRSDTGYRRIRGPAGSGKSLVLAARAARLANEGRSVLIATFNITLWHYLKDLIGRGLRDLDAARGKQDNIQLTHFHRWCRDVCRDVGWERKLDNLWRSAQDDEQRKRDVLNFELPRLADEAVMEPGATKYDAILVDEGQDYQPLWWNALRKACKPGGEMLLVADATQDVYGTAKAWTNDVMTGAGFRGAWAQLSGSYRLPPDIINVIRAFAETFLPADAIDLPVTAQESMRQLEPCNLRWIQCEPQRADKVCSDEILSLMRQTGKSGLANADITVLTGTRAFGASVVERLSEHKIKTVHTFGDDHTRQKMGFYMGDARVKATTFHSFKGWESRLLVVYIADTSHAQSLALIYTGLTRLKRSPEGSWLTVVCSAPELKEYGETWNADVALR